jgi:hypothetical protein
MKGTGFTTSGIFTANNAYFGGTGTSTANLYSTNGNVNIYPSSTLVGAFSSTGLAVTGLTDISAATSGQIKFPATQNASSNANTLDDYEEGTWTPVYQGSTGSAGSAAYSSSGSYTKIGRLVNLNCRLDITNVGSWTGNFQISGTPFPFTAGSSGADFHGVTRIASVTFGALVSYYVSRLPSGGNVLDLVGIVTAAAVTILPTSALSSSSTIIVEITYFV